MYRKLLHLVDPSLLALDDRDAQTPDWTPLLATSADGAPDEGGGARLPRAADLGRLRRQEPEGAPE